MGTSVAIEAAAEAEATALEGIEAAFAAVLAVERRMHPTRAGSDVQRINTARSGAPVAIHSSTWQVLELAQRLCALTDGVFDPCLPTCPGHLGNLELSPPSAARPWAIGHAAMALDLGGIAKGYAIDAAVDALIGAGCTSGLVNAGGDLRVFGKDPQRILLRRSQGSCFPLELSSSALAVSERDASRRPTEHQGYYARGRTVSPMRRSAAVIATLAVTADALTKCALLCEEERTQIVLRAFRARIADGA